MYASIPLTVSPDGRRLYVPVEIAGASKRLVLDTGAAITALSDASARELGLSIRQSNIRYYGVTGDYADKYAAAPMKIGKLSGGSIKFMVVSSLDKLGEPDVVGLLGADILSHFDVSLDIANAKLDLLDPEHCKDQVIYWPASAIARVPVDRLPLKHLVVKLELDGKPVKAILDTGATQSTIHVDVAKRLFGVEPGTTDTPQTGFLNNRADLAIYHHIFKTLSFEGVTVSNPNFALIPDMVSKPMSRTPTGSHLEVKDESAEPDILLGMNILRHVRFYIAYKDEMVYITPATPPATAK